MKPIERLVPTRKRPENLGLGEGGSKRHGRSFSQQDTGFSAGEGNEERCREPRILQPLGLHTHYSCLCPQGNITCPQFSSHGSQRLRRQVLTG